MNKILAIILTFIIIASSGCSGSGSTSAAEEAVVTDTSDTLTNVQAICKSLCEERLERDMDISSGPCLTDPLAIEDDWVCDIVHNPRTTEDDKEKNQCQAYLDGTASHFIELDTGCNIVRIE